MAQQVTTDHSQQEPREADSGAAVSAAQRQRREMQAELDRWETS